MAKKALINKSQRKPKFAVRAYTRCNKCGRPHAVFRKFGLCRICLREMAHAGELPGVARAAGNPANHETVLQPPDQLREQVRSRPGPGTTARKATPLS